MSIPTLNLGRVQPNFLGKFNPNTTYRNMDVVFCYDTSWMFVGAEPVQANTVLTENWVKYIKPPEPITAESWAEVQQIVRDGNGARAFPLGTEFTVTKTGGNIIFQVVDIGDATTYITANGNAPTDPEYFVQYPKATPLTLIIKYVTYGIMFSKAQPTNPDGNRLLYGSNNYLESAVRQYLNSNGVAGSYWTAQTDYDVAPSWNATLNGLQYQMDIDFLNIIGLTTREVELNTVTDGGGNITASDKFFLPSRKEIFNAAENGTHKGRQFSYYIGADNAKRIRYDITNKVTPRYWWLRSPSAGSSISVRAVYSDGAFSYYHAYNGIGVAPACVIL